MNDYDGYGAMIAFWLILAPILLLFALVGYIVGSFFLMKVFEKAGVQGKWRAWVPVYNALVLAKLGDLSPWVMLGAIAVSALLGSIPGIGFIFSAVGLVAGVLASWRVGLKLGKDWPYLLLWLIPGVGTLIWLGILAFGKEGWNPNIPPAPWANSFLKDTTVWQGIPVQPGASVTAAPPVAGGYTPAAGYQPPPPPAGYAPPPGYTPPPASPAAPPASPPAAAPEPVAPPEAPEPPAAPPAAPEPPSTPPAPPTNPPPPPSTPPAS
jgi:hypothetical protein